MLKFDLKIFLILELKFIYLLNLSIIKLYYFQQINYLSLMNNKY